MEEAVSRRQEFDTSVGSFEERMSELEGRYAETDEQPMRVQEKVETIRVGQGSAF